MIEEDGNTNSADDARARGIYGAIRSKQLHKQAESMSDKRRPKNRVRLQFLGFRKRLAVFAIAMTGIMGYYILSFILGWPGGPELGNALDSLTLKIVNAIASVVPSGDVFASPVRNALSFTPLGVIFGACVVAFAATLVISFAYAAFVTALERDKHDSNFMME